MRSIRGTTIAIGISAALSVLASSGVRATEVQFTFVDVSSTFQGSTYDLSGSFDWDDVTEDATNLDVTLSGTGVYAGLYTASNGGGDNATGDIFSTTNPDLFINIQFDNYLNGADVPQVVGYATDPVGSILFYDTQPYTHLVGYSSTTGYATPDPIVPEPSTLILLGAGLAGLSVARHRRNSGGSSHAGILLH